jgi:hypothetical protein
VKFVCRLICCIIPKSFTEISICAIALLRASHPSHIAVLIEVDGVLELANDIGIVVILECCNVKNTKLLHTLINKMKIMLNVIVVVRHVESMLVYNPAPLELSLDIVVIIPHLLLTFSPEHLVRSSIGPLLETIWITETKHPPLFSMHCAKVAFRNLLQLFGIWRSFLVLVDFLITGRFSDLLGTTVVLALDRDPSGLSVRALLPSNSSPTSSPSSESTSNAKRNNETNAQVRYEAKSELAQYTSRHSRASGRKKKIRYGVAGRYNRTCTGAGTGRPVVVRQNWATHRDAGGSPAAGLCAGWAGARPSADQGCAGEQIHV